MALSSELHEVLARRRRPLQRELRLEAQSERKTRDISAGEDPDDVIDPDDSGPRLLVTLKEPVAEIYDLPASQAEQTSGRYPDTADQSNAPGSPPVATAEAASTPALPDLLDPAVLRTMPPRVAAFMLYEPPDSPPWRSPPPPAGADDGSWVG